VNVVERKGGKTFLEFTKGGKKGEFGEKRVYWGQEVRADFNLAHSVSYHVGGREEKLRF